jgi:hypothetical protein
MITFAAAVVLLLSSAVSYASAIIIPSIEGKPGQVIDIPVIIDEIENLAGVKLVFKYDKSVLIFQKADKTAATTSLMHVVNDRNPGSLIVVMAGARGIKGRDMTILTMTFEISKNLKTDQQSSIDITEVQLMSDQLKNLEYTIKTHPISIISEKKDKSDGKEKTDAENKNDECH